MSLLDAVGVEAAVCAGLLLLTLLLYVTWLSSAVVHQPLHVRAVIVDERLLTSQPGHAPRRDDVISSGGTAEEEGEGERDRTVAASSDTAADTALREQAGPSDHQAADSDRPSECVTGSDRELSTSHHNTSYTRPVVSSQSSSQSSAVTAGHDDDGAGLTCPARSPADPGARCLPSPIQSVTFKLRFLNDVERTVEADVSETWDRFKRRNFVAETSAGHTVRLIYKGHVLSDSASLSECGLHDDCVVHCHISNSSARDSGAGTAGGAAVGELEQLDLGFMLQPLLICVLAMLWLVHHQFPHLFSNTASLILTTFTLMMTVSLVRSLLTRRQR